jgi:hypothetical protein
MPLAAPAPQAPYDSLATITQMVRTLLGDFVQNIQANNVGTLNVNGGGLSVTWVSGNQFTALMNGVQIVINGVPNTIALVTSPTTATLVNPAAVANGLAFSIAISTGDIFADSQNYVVPTINLAWRKLQTNLALKGHPRLENTVILTKLPVVANLDPAVECYINWQGFYDGVTLWTPQTLAGCPTLPPDFISPLYLEERQSLTGATAQNPNLNRLRRMHFAPNGLRSRPKSSYNRYFDWREDAIYFAGAILNLDVKARYAAYLADIAPGATFQVTPVPIMGCAESLANYSAAIFVTPRGSLLGPSFEAAGDASLSQITNSFSKLQQRASYSRIAWGARGRNRRRGLVN